MTVGDVVFKFWVEEPKRFLYVTGIVIYLAGLLCLVESFKSYNIAVASAIFVIVNICTLALVSWLYFGEKLTGMQIAGIALAFLAILLLKLGSGAA